MAPAFSKIAENKTQYKRRKLNAPISLDRPETPALIKGQYITLKLRTTPGDADSTTYDLPFPYFSSGAPETWLRFKRNILKAIVGQNITSGPPKYALARRTLEGDALAAFDASAITNGGETNANFTTTLNALTTHLFPARALQTQKRYMRRYLRKPNDTRAREHVARVVEINALLTEFPDPQVGVAATSLPDDELLDLLEYGCPNSWQKAMMIQDFDPVEHTISEFTQFCERLENTEDRTPTQKSTNKPKHESNRKRAREDKSESRSKSGFKKSTPGSKLDCLLHGENCGHSSDKCFTLKAQAKRMKGMYDSQTPSTKKDYKNKQELNSIVQLAVEKALKAQKKKKKSSKGENFNFDKLDISESEAASTHSSTNSDDSSSS
jgi:hypothetical protein